MTLSTVPGPVSSLAAVPDILSVVLNWIPPQMGVGFITEYGIRLRLDTILLSNIRVNGESMSHRIGRLRPGTEYQVEIRAFIGTLEGPSEVVTATTSVVGKN